VFKITSRYIRVTGAASVTVSTPGILIEDVAAAIAGTTVSIAASGTNIAVRVTPSTVATMYWAVTADIQHRYLG
jgi:uncharacterized protein YcsI (UPF0317 family)